MKEKCNTSEQEKKGRGEEEKDMGKITDIHVFVPRFVFNLCTKQEGGGIKSEIRRVTDSVKYYSSRDARVANEWWGDITGQWYTGLALSLFYYGVTDSENKASPTTYGWIESLNEWQQKRFAPLYHGRPGTTGDPVLIAGDCKEPLLTLRDLLIRIIEVYPERKSYMSDWEKKTLVHTVMEVASNVMSSRTHLSIVITILSLVGTNDAIGELEKIQKDKTIPKVSKIGLEEAIIKAKEKNARIRQ
jgi:hypothetical protein